MVCGLVCVFVIVNMAVEHRNRRSWWTGTGRWEMGVGKQLLGLSGR